MRGEERKEDTVLLFWKDKKGRKGRVGRWVGGEVVLLSLPKRSRATTAILNKWQQERREWRECGVLCVRPPCLNTRCVCVSDLSLCKDTQTKGKKREREKERDKKQKPPTQKKKEMR
jgi:hypothetical protein